MGARDDKKARERAVLDYLLTFAKIDATVLEEGEAPDFILDLQGQRIGVEVTEYVRGRSATGSTQRQQVKFIQSVMNEARLIFETGSTGPLWVTVDAEFDRASASPNTLAHLLAKQVAACLNGDELAPRPGPFGMPMPDSPLFHECAVPPDLQPVISRLTVVELPNRSVSSWRIRQSGDTRAFVGEIVALIASKDDRYQAYVARCAEAWLVIDAFGGDILQAITPTAEVVQHRYQTAFGRVYLVDRAEQRALLLLTESFQSEGSSRQ